MKGQNWRCCLSRATILFNRLVISGVKGSGSVTRFNAIYTIVILYLGLGVLLDGYNHMHGAPVDFLTYQHSVIYLAVFSLAILLGQRSIYSLKRDSGEGNAIPSGYFLSFLAIPFVFLGGIGDMFWHRTFGFETKTVEQISPSHLLLTVAFAIIVSGPLRHKLRTGIESEWRDQFPLLISVSLFLSVWTHLMVHLHPFINPYSATWYTAGQTPLSAQLGVAGILLYVIILQSVILVVVDRFTVVTGGLTFIISLHTIYMASIEGNYAFILVGIGCGIIADIFLFYVSLESRKRWAFRLFAFVTSTCLVSFYFFVIHLQGGIAWSVHVWTGVIFLSGIASVLVTYIKWPTSN